MTNNPDNNELHLFEFMVNAGARKHDEQQAQPSQIEEDGVYVSHGEGEDPDLLLMTQFVGEVLSNPFIREECYKTLEPNTTFRGPVTDLEKWYSEEVYELWEQREGGRWVIDITYFPEGRKLPWGVVVQIKESDPWFDTFKDLPADYRGEVIVKTDKNGLVVSVSLPD